ncbi:MAG: hypothetical protein NDI82_13835 [Anaeromyxobacteraceae bacterium]|nr:hypothetical protein [Anaeromyxobacteraceae bacterium]
MDAALATTLDTLGPLLAKVAEVHGPQDPRLAAVAEAFSGLRARLAAAPGDLAGAAAELERLAALTDGFAPPPHACRSYRRALADLEWLRWRLDRPGAGQPPHAASSGPNHAAERRHGAKR